MTFFFTLTYNIERRRMVFEMDFIIIVIIGIVIIGILILCLDKTKTHEEPKQVTYERIGLISEYEDSYPIISDEEDEWWNRKYKKLKDEISPDISELQALANHIKTNDPQLSRGTGQAIHLKLKMCKQSSPKTQLTETMSQEQLYELRDPLWFKGATIYDIRDKINECYDKGIYNPLFY